MRRSPTSNHHPHTFLPPGKSMFVQAVLLGNCWVIGVLELTEYPIEGEMSHWYRCAARTQPDKVGLERFLNAIHMYVNLALKTQTWTTHKKVITGTGPSQAIEPIAGYTLYRIC